MRAAEKERAKRLN